MAAAILAKIMNSGQDVDIPMNTDTPLKSDMLFTKSSVMRLLPMDRCQKRHLHLFPTTLECYGESNGNKYAKGIITLRDVKVVEPADDVVLQLPYTFQVVYEKDDDHNAWHFACHLRQQQEDWIKEIRKAAKAQGATFWQKYHPGGWKNNKWTCCMKGSKDMIGCQDATRAAAKGTAPRQNEGILRKKNLRKSVVAIADLDKQQDGDIALTKGEKYEILEDQHDLWWIVKSQTGDSGAVPREYLGEVLFEERGNESAPEGPKHAPKGTMVDNSGEDLDQYDWYFGKIPREMVDPILKSLRTDGCFLVRDSSSPGVYVVSLFSAVSDEVRHYKVKRDQNKMFHFNDYYKFNKVSELIEHHKKKCSGVESLLKMVPLDKTMMNGHWIIDESRLTKGARLGKGFFSIVYEGKLKDGLKTKTVAIKSMEFLEGSAVSIIKEMSTMARLNHPNLVSLHGVSFEQDHVNIVTEYMPNGDLQHYVVRQQGVLKHQINKLFGFLVQVNDAMCYLEGQNIIHRDLAARNCLVGPNETIKVCDFGMARFTEEGIYQPSDCSNMPLKWCSPEVLQMRIFSSKSDVWSFGVLAWEVYSFGDKPYGRLSNPDLFDELVHKGLRLSKPQSCPAEVYRIMQRCWEADPSDRPSFSDLYENFFKHSNQHI